MCAARAFIDTNVLLYAFTADEPDKQEIALEALDNCRPVVSTQVLKEFANVLLKKGNASMESVKETIGGITEAADVVNEEVALILASFAVHARHKFSFYDSLVVASALHAQCQVLLSEDLQDGQMIDGKLRIVNPFRA